MRSTVARRQKAQSRASNFERKYGVLDRAKQKRLREREAHMRYLSQFAIQIQRIVRSYVSRQKSKDYISSTRAARNIQRTYRGIMGRKLAAIRRRDLLRVVPSGCATDQLLLRSKTKFPAVSNSIKKFTEDDRDALLT